MIKFETINGQPCRMVEPEPLTPDSKLPCVVRLIQDNSPIGKLNKDEFKNYYLANHAQPYLQNRLIYNGETLIGHYSRFEIIGYPVVEGSAEWALHQMMQGKKVVSSNGTVYWQDKDDNDLIKYTDGYGQIWIQTPYLFLRCVGASGWQIYTEPKPEPAKEQFKVGDWWEHSSGSHHRIVKVDKKSKTFEIDDYEFPTFYLHNGYEVPDGIERGSYMSRKLDPSDVRVKITLEGQVTKPVDNAGGRFWLYYSTDEYLSVELDALSHKDRELVESLLKAQEEEK